MDLVSGSLYELTDERITIGRDATNQVQIGDPKASREHAENRSKPDDHLGGP